MACGYSTAFSSFSHVLTQHLVDHVLMHIVPQPKPLVCLGFAVAAAAVLH